ncbi:MAG TPA: hypothetical protein VNV17_05610 [Solirubrobacteraceae bacterium]|jgi:hypothetical protein|nr:hypothetical protein [Solirubrobacteraceae bacterium]
MNDWRMFRPAIWLAMLGVAVMLLVAPFYLGAVLLGAAVGIALRIEQGRRRLARGQSQRPRRRR